MKRVSRDEAHRRFLSAALWVGLAAGAVVGVYACVVFIWFPSYRGEQALVAARQGVAHRLEWLSVQGDQVALDPSLASALMSEDSDQVYGILKSAKDARGIGLMGAADKEGYIIARTRTINALGDDVFLTAPIGRALATGKESAAAVEVSDFDNKQVLFNTGRLVHEGTTTVGAVFSNFLADDEFSRRFASDFLRPGEHVAFYTRQYGVYGSSFDPADERILLTFVRPDSMIIRAAQDSIRVTLADGRQYLIRNVPLKGSETAETGMLVFVPVSPVFALQLLLVLLPLSFLVLSLWAHRVWWPQERAHHFWIPLGLIALLLAGVAWAEYGTIRTSFKVLPPSGYALYNSVLRFRPVSVAMSTKYTKDFAIVVDSGGEAVNAFGIHITYDPARIKITALDVSRSVCTDFITKNLDQIGGAVDIECGVRPPGFTGGDGEIGTITVQGLSEGAATLHYTDDNQVLAADGLGTDVLRLAQDASLTFDDTTLKNATADHPLFYSPTHPNSDWWYPSRNVQLVWQPRVAETVRLYRLATTGGPDTLMSTFTDATPPLNAKVPDDGVYEFRFLRKGWNTAYRVRVDTTPPEDVVFAASKTNVSPDELVRFLLTATDTASRLQRTAYVKTDDKTFYPFANTIYIPFKDEGDHTVTARVFDKAGNFRDSSIVIHVQ